MGLLLVFAVWPSMAQFNSEELIDIRIVGGTNAEMDEFPSTVSVQVRSRHYCGGVLIAKQWVLSAAHCWQYNKPNRVVIGSVNLSDKEQGEAFEVAEVFNHPEFGNPSQVSNDYALIRLEEMVENHPIAKINTMEPDEMDELMMTVVGWGALSEGGFSTSKLQKVDVPLVGKEACGKQLKDFNPNFSVELDDYMFCAGIPEGGKDACQGDSGGPIYAWDDVNQEYIVMGVVSWGIGCARPKLSGVYSDISEVLDWTDKVMLGERFLAASNIYNF